MSSKLIQMCATLLGRRHLANAYEVDAERRIPFLDKRVSGRYKNSSGDEIANVNFLTTISHTRRPTSKYRKRDKPTLFNKLDDR